MPDTDQHHAEPGIRARRRARTRTTILEAARATFAENGYEKATIRAVAERAGYDPALVMQHFGSKRALFRDATAIDLDVSEAFDGPEDTRTERVLRRTFERLDRHPEQAASTLRSMLTHDEYADEALKLFNPPAVADLVGDPDRRADLQHQLVTALVLGTAITRYVLANPAVQNATLDQLVASLQPAIDVLVPRRPAEE